jgi:hypothetical protein
LIAPSRINKKATRILLTQQQTRQGIVTLEGQCQQNEGVFQPVLANAFELLIDNPSSFGVQDGMKP